MKKEFDKKAFQKANDRFYIFFLIMFGLGLISAICAFCVNSGINIDEEKNNSDYNDDNYGNTDLDDDIPIENVDPKNYYGKYVETTQGRASITIDENNAELVYFADYGGQPKLLTYTYMTKEYANENYHLNSAYDIIFVWKDEYLGPYFQFYVINSTTLKLDKYLFVKTQDETPEPEEPTPNPEEPTPEPEEPTPDLTNVFEKYYGTYKSDNTLPAATIIITEDCLYINDVSYEYEFMTEESFELKYNIDTDYDAIVFYYNSRTYWMSFFDENTLIDEMSFEKFIKINNDEKTFIEQFCGKYICSFSMYIVIFETGAYFYIEGENYEFMPVDYYTAQQAEEIFGTEYFSESLFVYIYIDIGRGYLFEILDNGNLQLDSYIFIKVS